MKQIHLRWMLPVVFGAIAAPGPSRAATYTIDTATLNSYIGVHPRLLLDTATITSLRTDIANSSNPKSVLWAGIRSDADSKAVTKPAAFTEATASDTSQEWQRTTGNNIGDLAFAYLMTKPVGTPAGQSVWIEAEESLVALGPSNVMNALPDARAAAGRYIAPTGAGPVDAPGGQYTVSTANAASAGSYQIWLRVAATASANFKVQVDSLPAMEISLGVSTWTWVNAGAVSLTPGHHTLSILNGTTGVKIDKILISSESVYASSPPSGVGIEQHWLEAQKFTINTPANISIKGSAQADDQLSANPAYVVTLTSYSSPPATPDLTQSFQVTGGTYDVWVRFKCPYSFNNGQYFAVDSATPAKFWLPTQTPMPWREWVWQKIASNKTLAAGSHSLSLSGQMAGSLFDRFLVTTAGQPAPVDPNKYLVGMMKYAEASCDYPTWGAKLNTSTGRYTINDPTDLSAGHQLVGLALAYDWCYSDMSATDRQKIFDKLYDIALPGMYTGSNTRAWRSQPLQNHRYINLAGLGAATMAIYGESGVSSSLAMTWLNQTVSKFGETNDKLQPDGANHEGILYHEYGLSFHLQYTAMASKILGVTNLDTGLWFQQTPLYRLAASLPMNSWSTGGNSTTIDFADANRSDSAGPNYILRRLAMLCRTSNPINSALAQWMALQADQKNANYKAPWLGILWYDTSLPTLSPTAAGVPTLQFFNDLDFVMARSSWSGSESLLAYQCGPFMGHQTQALQAGTTYTDWGGGHAHPAANNFCLFGNGDWLIRNAGYVVPKFTNQTNTLLIGGAGQLGEGGSWLNATTIGHAEDPGGVLNPALIDALCFSTEPFDYLVGDATKAYPTSTGLRKFTRHLLFYKPDVLVVVDDVVLSASKALELRFFTQQSAVTTVNSTTYTTTGTNAKLKLNLLSPGSVFGTNTMTVSDNAGTQSQRRYVSVTPTGGSSAAWGQATALTWSAASGTPKTVTMITDDSNTWKFRVAGANATMVLNRTSANGGLDKARLVTVFEAESGTFPVAGTNMQTYTDATASGGTYVSTKPLMSGTPNPDITYSFSVPMTSLGANPSYALWVRCQAADGSSDAFYYGVGAAASTLQVVITPPYNSWRWIKIADVNHGSHALNILHRDANCKIDQFLVTDDPSFTPLGAY